MRRIIPIGGIILSLSALLYRIYLVQSANELFLAPGLSYTLIVVGLVWTALGLAFDYY